jgi:hypothetical protein
MTKYQNDSSDVLFDNDLNACALFFPYNIGSVFAAHLQRSVFSAREQCGPFNFISFIASRKRSHLHIL